ncbi:hypothetical protein SDC9_122817 [bioreactor metagenome]|uniref:Uncharacterized protein n=1 Tax=bioreactor metagenome TaxID=1076179 RepID=A0A645CFZ3_9ZZZZ
MKTTYPRRSIFGDTGDRNAAGRGAPLSGQRQLRAGASRPLGSSLFVLSAEGHFIRRGTGGYLSFQICPGLAYIVNIFVRGCPAPVYILTETGQRSLGIPSAKIIHAKTFEQCQRRDSFLSVHRYRLLFHSMASTLTTEKNTRHANYLPLFYAGGISLSIAKTPWQNNEYHNEAYFTP